jgi:DNA-binding transcriptional MerR regulator
LNIKKKCISTLGEVYSLIGISKQNISYWQKNFTSTQTKIFFKLKIIRAAGECFKLNNEEIERLANKAGFSFCNDINFSQYFCSLIAKYPGKKYELYDEAQVSERMFRYAKKGKCLTKETLLSIAITLGLKLEEIQVLLKKAGFILSKSLPNDMVIIWLIEHDERPSKKISRISYINDVLYSLDMPLLMTRDKF